MNAQALKPVTRTERKPVFWCMNRKLNTAEVMDGFGYWEEVQMAFHVGIMMSDGNSANAIGRTRSLAEFQRKAAHGGTKILTH